MNTYLISRKANSENSRAEFGDLIASMAYQSLIHENLWVFKSDLSIDELFEAFKNTIDVSDEIFLTELGLEKRFTSIESSDANYLSLL